MAERVRSKLDEEQQGVKMEGIDTVSVLTQVKSQVLFVVPVMALCEGSTRRALGYEVKVI